MRGTGLGWEEITDFGVSENGVNRFFAARVSIRGNGAVSIVIIVFYCAVVWRQKKLPCLFYHHRLIRKTPSSLRVRGNIHHETSASLTSFAPVEFDFLAENWHRERNLVRNISSMSRREIIPGNTLTTSGLAIWQTLTGKRLLPVQRRDDQALICQRQIRVALNRLRGLLHSSYVQTHTTLSGDRGHDETIYRIVTECVDTNTQKHSKRYSHSRIDAKPEH